MVCQTDLSAGDSYPARERIWARIAIDERAQYSILLLAAAPVPWRKNVAHPGWEVVAIEYGVRLLNQETGEPYYNYDGSLDTDCDLDGRYVDSEWFATKEEALVVAIDTWVRPHYLRTYYRMEYTVRYERD